METNITGCCCDQVIYGNVYQKQQFSSFTFEPQSLPALLSSKMETTVRTHLTYCTFTKDLDLKVSDHFSHFSGFKVNPIVFRNVKKHVRWRIF